MCLLEEESLLLHLTSTWCIWAIAHQPIWYEKSLHLVEQESLPEFYENNDSMHESLAHGKCLQLHHTFNCCLQTTYMPYFATKWHLLLVSCIQASQWETATGSQKHHLIKQAKVHSIFVFNNGRVLLWWFGWHVTLTNADVANFKIRGVGLILNRHPANMFACLSKRFCIWLRVSRIWMAARWWSQCGQGNKQHKRQQQWNKVARCW